MIGPSERQVSLFYVAFGAEASLIKDDLLEPIDELLKDAQLIEAVRDALGRRCPKSSKTGRNGIAPDRLLRLVVLKHLKQCAFVISSEKFALALSIGASAGSTVIAFLITRTCHVVLPRSRRRPNG